MTEEVADNTNEEVNTDTTNNETVELTAAEKKATERGWRPKSEYQGDPDEFVEAEEFLKREPLYKAIHKHSRENKRLVDMNNEIKRLLQDVQKNAKTQALKELRQQYEDAALNNDVKGAVEAHSKIVELTKQPDTKVTTGDTAGAAADAPTPIFKSWAKSNDWYSTDKVLTRYANGVGSELLAQKVAEVGGEENLTDEDLREVYDRVTVEVKEAYPEKFVTTSRTRTTTVTEGARRTNGNGNGGRSSNKPSFDNLPEEAQMVYKLVVKSKSNPKGTFDSGEEYIESYLAGGGKLR